MNLTQIIRERQIRQIANPACIERTDIRPKRTPEQWNIAGQPRKYSRAYRRVRGSVFVRDGFRCLPGTLGACPFCNGAVLPVGALQADHVIAWSANGPASFAYQYARPVWNGQDWVRTGNRLHIFIDTFITGGENVLYALYGEHAAIILDPDYDAECDAYNLMTVCAPYNMMYGDTPKQNELLLIEEIVRRENASTFSPSVTSLESFNEVVKVMNEMAITNECQSMQSAAVTAAL